MKVIVLIGPSGTGKSYQAVTLAKENNIKYIIDDGLLIKGNKVLAGLSAKKEKSRMAAVKRAVFMDYAHRKEIKETLEAEKPEKILILGTSEKMVESIVSALSLGPIEKKIYIQDITSEEEIKLAKKCRIKEGKHVIPVPTFEIKKEFSGYFLNPLKIFRRLGMEEADEMLEKSVVRPTFSYLGKYTISDRVIRELVLYASKNTEGIYKVQNIDIINASRGLIINMDIKVLYGYPIKSLMERVQNLVIHEVEEMTSFIIISVNISVKGMIMEEKN